MTAVAPLVLFPFFDGNVLGAVLLWLLPFTVLWLLMEPSRRSDEMLHDARTRAGGEILRDPLAYLLLAVAVLAVIRWMNEGIALAYLPEDRAWTISKPPVDWLPGSVAGCGRLPFAVACQLAVVTLGCRHALGKSARVSFLFSGCLFAGVAALAAVILGALGNGTVLLAERCQPVDSSYFGSGFGLWALAGVVAVSGGFELRWNKYLLLFSLGIGGSLTGLFFFAPTHVVIAYAAAFVVTLAGSLAYSWFTIGSTETCKCFIAIFLALLVPVLMCLWVASPDMLNDRFALFRDGVLFPEGFLDARKALSAVAAKAWSAHPWSGTGLGSFPLDIRFHALPEDWNLFEHLQVTAHHGWWQFLAERGLVGALALAGLVGILLAAFAIRLVGSFGKSYFAPGAYFGFVVAAVVAAESFVDVSMLRPEIALAALPLMAISVGSLPLSNRNANPSARDTSASSGDGKENPNHG